MSKIDIKEVKHLAELSALSFSEQQLEQFVPEFNNILNLINQINQADTDREMEYLGAVDVSMLREDVAGESMPQDLALINAPKSRKGCYNVPRVVD